LTTIEGKEKNIYCDSIQSLMPGVADLINLTIGMLQKLKI
jgi:hypothetical protein